MLWLRTSLISKISTYECSNNCDECGYFSFCMRHASPSLSTHITRCNTQYFFFLFHSILSLRFVGQHFNYFYPFYIRFGGDPLQLFSSLCSSTCILIWFGPFFISPSFNTNLIYEENFLFSFRWERDATNIS